MRCEVTSLRTDPVALEVADHGRHPAMRDGIDGPIVQPFEIEGLLRTLRDHRVDVAATRGFAADIDPARGFSAHWILSAPSRPTPLCPGPRRSSPRRSPPR